MTAAKPGVYPRMPFAEYLALDAVNHTQLKWMDPTPAHGRARMLHPPASTAAQDFGQIAHAAVLEPGRFARDYVCFDEWVRDEDAGKAALAQFQATRSLRLQKGDVKADRGLEVDRVTTEGKDLWRAFDAVRGGRIMVEAEHVGRLRGMQRALASDAHATARALLYGEGEPECVVVWRDQATGLLCKIRLDKLSTFAGYAWAVDLKSCEDASEHACARIVATLSYHSQAAFYGDGLRELGRKVPSLARDWRFVHVFVESQEPHEVAVRELDDQAITSGRLLYRRWLDQYAECRTSGVWPGYPDGPEPLALPRWAVAPEARLAE